ncbi:hypothetical protein [Aminobacter sp. LjRoot7]|uniref:hypothetical protein n=1 Tax=Aminobacter sp. LjRoot7 TaxID=3342335 RepID=UPI003ECE6A2A
MRHSVAASGASTQQGRQAPRGWTPIVVGNLVGLLFALVALSTKVVACCCSIATSARAIGKPGADAALWGLIVAAGLVLGSIPLLVGLAIVLPVLGHSTSHLYRKLIEPAPAPVPVKKSRKRTA